MATTPPPAVAEALERLRRRLKAYAFVLHADYDDTDLALIRDHLHAGAGPGGETEYEPLIDAAANVVRAVNQYLTEMPDLVYVAVEILAAMLPKEKTDG